MKFLGRAGKTTLAAAAVATLAMACGGSGGDSTPETAQAADAIYTNGKVVSVDGSFSIAQAFAVKDGKFLAVGSNADIRRHAASATQVVDLQGRTVIPGLGDGHLHSVGGGAGIDLSKARTLAEFLQQVANAAQAAAPGTILVSNSDWHEAQLQEQRTPTAAELESAAPGIALVVRRGGHSYFLNNTALARWNITPSTPVPQGGSMPKDANGNLTGEVSNNARTLVTLPPSPALSMQDLLAEQAVMNSHGLTSVRIPGTSVAHYRLLQQMRDADTATVRYSVLFRGTPQALAQEGIAQDQGDEWVKVWGVKMAVDGGFEGGHMTRAYEEPRGLGGTYFGLATITKAAFNQQVSDWNREGWRVTVHAVGDAGLDQVLEGFELAHAEKSIRGKGWTVEHAFVTRPDQYPRMKSLDLRLSVQDHLYLVAPTLRGYWGMERASQVTPVRTYLDQGFVVAGGTDASVIPVNPFWVIYHFLTRDTITGGVYGENQAVTREEALKLLTINYARLTDESDIKGSIEPGKLADFVVLSADYMTIPAAEVENLKAVATYVDGKQVFKDPHVAL
jgi:predicted amidohydrolase YtcJ